MNVEKTPIDGLLIIHPTVYADSRGFFFESYNAAHFREIGIDMDWVQDNHAKSVQHTVRGLHYQRGRGQAKLVRCIRGAIWDVAVDIRPDSPTLGRWFGLELTEENKRLLFIPTGFAHGYAVLSETAEVFYKCDNPYVAELEDGMAWNDPELSVTWPVGEPILSARDVQAKSFKHYLESLIASAR